MGGGKMGELIREKDWSETSLGIPEYWPQSLRTTISTCLNSRFPILVWWGPDLVMLYNDAYRPMLGEKHPASLGEKGRLVWPEIWNIIGPMLHGVYEQGLSTWSENQLLLLNRHGFAEECYFTFSYSPIYDESGGIGGVYCAVTETTETVLNEWQLKTLQEINNPDIINKTADDVYRSAGKALEKNNKDFPFGIIYKIEDPQALARPVAFIGLNKDQIVFPSSIDLSHPSEGCFNFCRAFQKKQIVISENKGRRKNLPTGGWDKEPTHFIHIPMINAGSEYPNAILSAALNPYRSFDEGYRQFATLVADQIALEVNNVLAFEEERKRAEALAEIDRAKTMFFSNISHEFRTPLTLMLGPLEEVLKEEQQLSQKSRENLSVSYRNTLRLQKLVNTLLDFSRIEAGRIQGVFQPVNIAALTRDLAGTFRSAIEKAGMQLIIHCNEIGEPAYVDIDMWEKIVLNLVSNAFKYSKRGSIEVRVEKEGPQIKLTVKDTGIGIAEEEIPKIFERFYRVRNVDGRSQEGTGIGLAMIRELVRLHHGTIGVKSRLGEGSEFVVSIPAGKDHLPADKIRKEDPSHVLFSNQWRIYQEEAKKWIDFSESKQRQNTIPAIHPYEEKETILIADDNADMRNYITHLLEERFSTILCSNGEEAFEQTIAQKPALVISDIMMPRLDGFGLLERLRNHPSTKNIPVIFLSARAGEEAIVEGMAAGADDYLVKPFSAKEFIAKVEAHIKLVNARRATEKNLFSLFTEAPVGAAVFAGESMIIEMVNDTLLQYWGRRREEVLNKSLWEAIPEAKEQGFDKIAAEVYRTGQRYVSSETPVSLMRNGKWETIYVGFVFEPRRDDHGTVVGMMTIVNDITQQVMARRKVEEIVKQRTKELMDSNEALLLSNQALERTNQHLREFTYAASHDMKEPIRKVNYFANRIIDKMKANGSVEELGYFTRMKNAVGRMESILDDLLSYSQLNVTPDQVEKVDLNEIIMQVLTDLEASIEKQKAEIHIDNLKIVHGYPRQLQQAFENLISNALKFHQPDQFPVLYITGKEIYGSDLPLASVKDDLLYTVIEVKDEGIGFDPRESERIFNVFTRLHGNAEYEGTGIGLSIVRKVMENHRGFVFAKSEPSKGSSFYLVFPQPENIG